MPATAKKSPATNTRGTQTVEDVATPKTLDEIDEMMKTREKETKEMAAALQSVKKEHDHAMLSLIFSMAVSAFMAIIVYFFPKKE